MRNKLRCCQAHYFFPQSSTSSISAILSEEVWESCPTSLPEGTGGRNQLVYFSAFRLLRDFKWSMKRRQGRWTLSSVHDRISNFLPKFSENKTRLKVWRNINNWCRRIYENAARNPCCFSHAVNSELMLLFSYTYFPTNILIVLGYGFLELCLSQKKVDKFPLKISVDIYNTTNKIFAIFCNVYRTFIVDNLIFMHFI